MKENEIIEQLDECINLLTSLKASLTPIEVGESSSSTLDELREILTRLVHAGYTTNIRVILMKYGVSSLGHLDPKYYKEVLERAKELEAYRGKENATK